MKAGSITVRNGKEFVISHAPEGDPDFFVVIPLREALSSEPNGGEVTIVTASRCYILQLSLLHSTDRKDLARSDWTETDLDTELLSDYTRFSITGAQIREEFLTKAKYGGPIMSHEEAMQVARYCRIAESDWNFGKEEEG